MTLEGSNNPRLFFFTGGISEILSTKTNIAVFLD